MAVFSGFAFLLAVFSTIVPAKGYFGINLPFPENQYPIEHTPVQVTCVAYDTKGEKMPDRILFVRKNTTGDFYANLTANDNMNFTTRREDNGRKLFVTLHIRNVTMEDDTFSGGSLQAYQCHAYSTNDTKPAQHGFSITVFKRNEIPKLETTKVEVLQHGDKATIHCNITDRGSRASKLLKMSWLKNGVTLHSIEGKEIPQALGPLVIENADVEYGGNYTCVLEVKLRDIKYYNTSAHTFISLEPWFETEEDALAAGIIGKDVKLPCSARGFPLKVEWKLQKKENEMVTACLDSSKDQRYNISRKGMYEPYSLSITNLNSTDLGNYYCCLPSNCSEKIDENRCQQIKLFLIDPRSGATMALVARAVLLAMVFFAASFLSF